MTSSYIRGTSSDAIRQAGNPARGTVVGSTIRDVDDDAFDINKGQMTIYNTIIADVADDAIAERSNSVVTHDYNLYHDIRGTRHNGTSAGDNDVLGDPKFLTELGPEVNVGSIGIDAGRAIDPIAGIDVTLDLLGLTQPSAGGWDIGGASFAMTLAVIPFSDTFESGFDAAWIGAKRTSSGLPGHYLGKYQGTPSTREELVLPLATTNGTPYEIVFDLAIFKSWDGSTGSYAPDSVRVAIDGVTVFDKTFTVKNSHAATYMGPDDPSLRTSSRRVFPDITVPFTAAGAITQIAWSSDVTGSDETFGIDNVRVDVEMPLFTDITSDAGFGFVATTSPDAGPGIAIADYDNDGFQDAVIGGSNARLVMNDRDGTWTLRAFESYTPRDQIAVVDLDDDGDLDVWAATASSPGREHGWLQTSTKLVDAGGDLGLIAAGSSTGLAAIDTDADGRIDLAHFGTLANTLGVNTGLAGPGGTPPVVFSADTGLLTGLNDAGDYGSGMFASAADVNNDGYLDVLYGLGSGRLFVSNGDGSFTHSNGGITLTSSASDRFGTAWADYDNDGDMDVFVPDNRATQSGALFRNTGGSFSNVASAAGLADASSHRSAAWGDVDHDGDLDLLLTNEADSGAVLYLSNGDGTFSPGINTGANVTGHTLDAAFADIDNDGDLDLVVTREDEDAVLLRNNTDSTASLQVGFVGAGAGATNRAGVGVRVELLSASGTFIARRELGTARGYGGAGGLRAHFGGINPASTYTVRFTVPGGATHEQSVVPNSTSATFSGGTVPRMLLFQEPPPPGYRVVRWREVSAVDDE
ncbi:MAG: VCBS repeat-containing protein [Planctomycetota bacterium]